MQWRRLLPYLLVAIAAWWFFTGDLPDGVWRRFVGRGRQLSRSTLSDGANCDQTIDDLVAQAAATMGRAVATDAYLLARVSASEHGGANAREKGAIQWVCKNDAAAHGWSISYTVTVNPGTLGTQAGRRYSTRFDPCEDDLEVAELILAGQLADITGGAQHFVHKSPAFVVSGGWSRVLTNWAGLSPVYLGNVSSLVVFVPSDQTAALQATAEPEPAA